MYIFEEVNQLYQKAENILTPEELELLKQICNRHEFNGYTLAYGLNYWAA